MQRREREERQRQRERDRDRERKEKPVLEQNGAFQAASVRDG